jgi:hypothetical protein
VRKRREIVVVVGGGGSEDVSPSAGELLQPGRFHQEEGLPPGDTVAATLAAARASSHR